jgi:hypothetical protein
MQTMGATKWSLVHIFPGAINHLLQQWGQPQFRFSSASPPDAIKEKIFTRSVAQTIAHEVLHALRYEWEDRTATTTPPGQVFNPHTNPAVASNDLMLPGGARRLLLRAGISVHSAGAPTDQGVAAMAQVLSGGSAGTASLDIIDQYNPRPGRGLLSP